MGTNTGISWTDSTWSPVTGCTPVSAGCDNCYAARYAQRCMGGFAPVRKAIPGGSAIVERSFSEVRTHADRLDIPLHWRKPRRIFVCSMSDLFHDQIEDAFLDRVFATMALSPRHVYQLLTKRPERALKYLSSPQRAFNIQRQMDNAAVEALAEREEWRSVLGYEGVYEISSHGLIRRVDSVRKGRRNEEGVLAPRVDRGGYHTVSLSLGSTVTQHRIARLVLEAFVCAPPNARSEARHRNGNRQDNRLANLVWGSKEENMQDAARHGTAGAWMKGRALFTPDQVAEIRRRRSEGVKLKQLAALHGTRIKHISAICLGRKYVSPSITWPLTNCWLGVTAENQAAADERIPLLLQTPAAVRFVSCEPLLSPVDLKKHFPKPMYHCTECGQEKISNHCAKCGTEDNTCTNQIVGIDWVICGGESGPNARPMHPEWVRSLRDQCVAANVPFHFKQWGEYCAPSQMPAETYRAWDYHHGTENCWDKDDPGRWRVGKKAAGRLLDGREWLEFPKVEGAK